MDGSMRPQTVDQAKLDAFAGKVVADIGGALAVLLAYMGDQTGVYRALRDSGPATSEELAMAAGVDERYLREWLSANAAAGYLTYDPVTRRFWLTPEQAIVLTAEGHPACFQGFKQIVVGHYATYEQAIEVFRTGAGRAWGDLHTCCFAGTDRFFRPGYDANLLTSWLPALAGVEDKLARGAKVADVGCGFGSSTVLMAEAFPRSTFVGFDLHEESIATARAKAADIGVTGNTRFETAKAKEIAERDFDLICLFDALHDMGDPVGAARHLRQCLKPDGTLMIVEPRAGDALEENLHLIGQLFYAASTLACTPASRAQEVGLALGAQAGEKQLKQVLHEAGYTRVRRVAETDTNMVLEATA